MKIKLNKWKTSSSKVKYTINFWLKSDKNKLKPKTVKELKKNYKIWRANITIYRKNIRTCNKKLSIKIKTFISFHKKPKRESIIWWLKPKELNHQEKCQLSSINQLDIFLHGHHLKLMDQEKVHGIMLLKLMHNHQKKCQQN